MRYAQLQAILEAERTLDPKLKRTSSWRNELGISHTTYLRMMKDLKMRPYNKITVMIFKHNVCLLFDFVSIKVKL